MWEDGTLNLGVVLVLMHMRAGILFGEVGVMAGEVMVVEVARVILFASCFC